MTGLIGVSVGDISGIGPEVTLKAIKNEARSDDARYLLIGHAPFIRQLNDQLSLALPLSDPSTTDNHSRFILLDPGKGFIEDRGPWTPASPSAARAAIIYLKEGAKRCLSGELDALVTAPVNKQSIIRSGQPFVGQTELLSELAGTKRTAMMLLGEDDRGRWLRVALVTTHLPIKNVPQSLNQPKIESVIELAAQACRDLGLPEARVAVCGLNPHAGEGGAVGDEEILIIEPAIKEVRKRGFNAKGPFSADTLFYHAYRGDFDAVVAMYHDQGLVPLKMIGFETGVNWTLGLPFIRTSPDHGTAYDISGQGIANPASMQAAIRLAKKLIRSRKAS